MNQIPLLNTVGMTSTKLMRSVQRARALDLFTKAVSQSSAGASSTSVSPQRLSEKWREEEAVSEFNFPDESRRFNASKLAECPECGFKWGGQLLRAIENKVNGLFLPQYKVQCSNSKCRFETPAFDSSRRAVSHWQLVSKILSRDK